MIFLREERSSNPETTGLSIWTYKSSIAHPHPTVYGSECNLNLTLTVSPTENVGVNSISLSFNMDDDAEIPKEVIDGLAELGLCGLAVSEDHGGMGLDYSLYSRVFGEIATIDGSVATFLGAHQSIGYRALINEGTDEQKKKWSKLISD